MIRTLINNDEQHCIDRLTGLLTTYCKPYIHLMDTCQAVEEGI